MVEWAQQKADEVLASAASNLEGGRLFPAAEDIFRTVETSLEGMLYTQGITEIKYTGKRKPFTGRLALQHLIRDHLIQRGHLQQEEYDRYKTLESDLHLAGYDPETTFKKEDLQHELRFAEDMLTKLRAMT